MYLNEETNEVMFTDAETRLFFEVTQIKCDVSFCDRCILNLPASKTCVRKVAIKAFERSL